MPMILSLALAVQAATLTSDPLQAPLICSTALALTSEGKSRLFKAATVSYLLTKRAAANPAGGPFFQQLSSMKTNGPKFPTDITPEMARQLAPLCDKRYPQARRDGPVKLPVDPLARDAVCLFALSTMGGAAGSMSNADAAVTARYNDAAKRFAAGFDTRIGEKNLADEAATGLATKLVIDGLGIGNAYIVSEACLALPAG